MMRWAAIFALAAGVACASSDDTDSDADTDADADADTDSDTDADAWHPLVPEEYWYLWNIDSPCERQGGREGNQVYMVLENAHLDENGAFSADEKWYWFYNTGDYGDDQVDTLKYTGGFSEEWQPSELGCITCEVVLEAHRDIIDNQTDTPYSTDVLFMLETQNSNQEWNEDGKIIVYYNRVKSDGDLSGKREYGRGQFIPENPEDTSAFWPADITWVGSYCL